MVSVYCNMETTVRQV